MATTGAALPTERGYLTRAWFAVAVVVLMAAAAIVLSMVLTGNDPAGGTTPTPVKDFGPVEVQHEPIVVNGEVCGQCR
jgi:flagellar basal body-associated protein FliL